MTHELKNGKHEANKQLDNEPELSMSSYTTRGFCGHFRWLFPVIY